MSETTKTTTEASTAAASATTASTMKVAYAHKLGDATISEVLSVVADQPIPQPSKGQILIKVHAAAMNPVDWKIVEGILPILFKAGPIGLDVSGTVEAIGPDTPTDLNVGDEVYGDIAATRGSFAEYVIAQEIALAKKPSNIDMVQAASLPLCGLTALQGLRTYGEMKEGDKVLIFGGSGGVGSLAIQMAKALGASEIYSTGSNVDMIKAFGADVVVNYKEESLMDALKGKDFDIVLDTIGGKEHWEVAQACLKPSGHFVTIIGDGGSSILGLFSMLWRNLYGKFVQGPTYSFFLTSVAAPAVISDMKTMTDLVEKGSVKPVLDEAKFELTTESLHEMVKASKSHRAKGKLVMKMV